jgi:carbamate kinase
MAMPRSRRRAAAAVSAAPAMAAPAARPLALIAFGGNALLRPEDRGTIEEQRRRAAEAAGWLVELLRRGHGLVIVHGNGPQVGNALIQMEEAATKIPPAPLDVAVAQTEGSIGYLLEAALRDRLRAEAIEREVATLLSLVVVDGSDPGFAAPSKPIGPFFPRFRAEMLEREMGWTMVEDAGRGFRKVVPSPRPLELLGTAAIRDLLDRGRVVIAAGGGGIPVLRDSDGRLRGVEAVVDKDRTAALLARQLGADLFIILTGVPRVTINFGKRNQRELSLLGLGEARRLLARRQFPAGSMGPKIEAAMDFVAATGKRVLITAVEDLAAALGGASGTYVVSNQERRAIALGRAAAPGSAT